MKRAFSALLLALSAGAFSRSFAQGGILPSALSEPPQPETQAAPQANALTNVDDSSARLKIQGLLAAYVRPGGGDWNITLELSVTEPESGPVSATVRLIGSSNLRRELTRNGRSVISDLSQGSGTITRDGTHESIPVWIVQSLHAPEFPFPMIAARLLDPATRVNFGPSDSTELVDIRLTKPILDARGKRVPLAEKIYDSDLYFDPSTGLLLKERYWIFSPSSLTNNAQVEVTYSDYQAVNGIQVPFRITKRLGGILLSDTIVQSIDLNANNPILRIIE